MLPNYHADTASEEEYTELLTGSDELSISEEDDHHSQSG